MPGWNLSLNQNIALLVFTFTLLKCYTHYFLPHLESGDFAEHTEVQCWAGKEGSPLDLNLEAINDSEGLTLYDQSKDIPELKNPAAWFPHAIMGIFNIRFNLHYL